MLSSCHLAGLCCCSLVSQLKLTFKYMYICCNMKRLNLRSQCYFCVLCRCFNKQQLFPHDRRFSSSWSAAYETGGLGRGFEGSRLGKEIPCRSYTKGQSRRANIQGSRSNLRCAAWLKCTLQLISCFHRAFFKVNHFYWPTNAFNCIKLNRLKSTWINILKTIRNSDMFRILWDPSSGSIKTCFTEITWDVLCA